MKITDVLSNNYYEFFNRYGEIEPTSRGINMVADWVLEFSDYPEEMWEDPKDQKLIAKACITANFDDFADMAGAIRRNAKEYAKRLIDQNSDYLLDLYYDQLNQRDEPQDDFKHKISEAILKAHHDYMASVK